jgi:hypothetical protein
MTKADLVPARLEVVRLVPIRFSSLDASIETELSTAEGRYPRLEVAW